MAFVCLIIIGFVTITPISLFVDCVASKEGNNEQKKN